MLIRIFLIGLVCISNMTNLLGMHQGADEKSVSGISLSVRSQRVLKDVVIAPVTGGTGDSSTQSGTDASSNSNNSTASRQSTDSSSSAGQKKRKSVTLAITVKARDGNKDGKEAKSPEVVDDGADKLANDVKVFDIEDEEDGAGTYRMTQLKRQLTGYDLSNADWKQHQDIKADHFNDAKSFEAMRALFYAVKHANLKIIQQLQKADEKKLEAIVNGFQENYKALNDGQRGQLKTVFDSHSVLSKIGVCSFLWVAVEYALQSKNVRNPCYKPRLEIVEILAKLTTNKTECHVVRTREVPTCLSFFCLPCCGPCTSKAQDVKGGLLHHAAQENNGHIVGTLLNHGFDVTAEDEMGWTPLSYALWYESKSAERAIKCFLMPKDKQINMLGLSEHEWLQWKEAARKKLPSCCCTC